MGSLGVRHYRARTHRWWKGVKDVSWSSFKRALNLFMRALPSQHKHLPKSLPPIPSHWALDFNTCIWGDTNSKGFLNKFQYACVRKLSQTNSQFSACSEISENSLPIWRQNQIQQIWIPQKVPPALGWVTGLLPGLLTDWLWIRDSHDLLSFS